MILFKGNFHPARQSVWYFIILNKNSLGYGRILILKTFQYFASQQDSEASTGVTRFGCERFFNILGQFG